VIPGARRQLPAAVIELHRAATLMLQVVQSDWPPGSESASPGAAAHQGGDSSNEAADRDAFRDHRNYIMKEFAPCAEITPGHVKAIFPNSPVERSSESDSLSPIRRPEDLDQTLRLLYDADYALIRAERILVESRKNIWWATWFFELRMQLIELQLLAHVADDWREPIPVLGSEAAPIVSAGDEWEKRIGKIYGYERTRLAGATAADELLGQTLRLAYRDPFRLARVAESYVNCFILFRIRLARPDFPRSNRVHLEPRRRSMQEACQEVYERLEELFQQRRKDQAPDEQLDPDVVAYIESVLKHLKRHAKQNRNR
jgi:hypothetical protein